MQDFDKVRPVEMLKSFVQARSSNTLKATPASNLPGRGSVAKAELGEDCLLLRAYRMRIEPEILEAPEILLPASRRIINPSVLDFSVKARERRLEPHHIKQASSFLHDPEWVAKMTTSISVRATAFSLTDEHIAQADALVPVIFARLEQHISLKVKVDRQQHWCVQWIKENIGAMCALSMLLGHLRLKTHPDPPSYECLLTRQWARFIEIDAQNSHLEGAYGHLHRDLMAEIEELIRAGKVAGETRNFGIRGEEHHKGATLTQPSPTSLYYKYPSTEVMQDASTVSKKGDFENLTMHIFVGFDRKDEQALAVLCDLQQQNFVWPEPMCKTLKACTCHDLTFRNKQLQMLSFLWELFYELTLSSTANVSESPGFEKFLRDFAHSD